MTVHVHIAPLYREITRMRAWHHCTGATSTTHLSAQERTLALYLAKRPYYSYETASALALLGIQKAELVALAQSLGDKTGDPVHQNSDHNVHILFVFLDNAHVQHVHALQVNIFTFKGVEYIGLESRKRDYDRDKAAGTNFIEDKIKRGDYDRLFRGHLGS